MNLCEKTQIEIETRRAEGRPLGEAEGEHLTGCADCQSYRDFVGRSSLSLSDPGSTQPWPELWSRLQGQRRLFQGLVIGALIFEAVCAALLLLLLPNKAWALLYLPAAAATVLAFWLARRESERALVRLSETGGDGYAVYRDELRLRIRRAARAPWIMIGGGVLSTEALSSLLLEGLSPLRFAVKAALALCFLGFVLLGASIQWRLLPRLRLELSGLEPADV